MPAKFITPPLSLWGLTNTGAAEQLLLQCFNNSGGSLAHGDVTIIDNSAGQMPAAPGSITGAVTTTTTAKNNLVLGPISVTGDASTNAQTVANQAACFVACTGAARVQVGAQTAAAASALSTTTTVKQALGTALPLAVADITTVFGIALESQAARDANNTLRALIKYA